MQAYLSFMHCDSTEIDTHLYFGTTSSGCSLFQAHNIINKLMCRLKQLLLVRMPLVNFPSHSSAHWKYGSSVWLILGHAWEVCWHQQSVKAQCSSFCGSYVLESTPILHHMHRAISSCLSFNLLHPKCSHQQHWMPWKTSQRTPCLWTCNHKVCLRGAFVCSKHDTRFQSYISSWGKCAHAMC